MALPLIVDGGGSLGHHVHHKAVEFTSSRHLMESLPVVEELDSSETRSGKGLVGNKLYVRTPYSFFSLTRFFHLPCHARGIEAGNI